MEMLEELQLLYVRLVLQVPRSTPKESLRSETGLLSMRLRVEMEKVMMILHVRHMPNDCLAKKIYDEQLEYDWPGLVKESRDICRKLEIEDVNETPMMKKGYKKAIKEAARIFDDKELKKKMSDKKKLSNIIDDDCRLKNYFSDKSLHFVRDLFKIRTNMNKIRGNYKNDPNIVRSGIKCMACGYNSEVNSHIVDCFGYTDLRVGKDLRIDKDMVNFFREVMVRRTTLENRKS